MRFHQMFLIKHIQNTKMIEQQAQPMKDLSIQHQKHIRWVWLFTGNICSTFNVNLQAYFFYVRIIRWYQYMSEFIEYFFYLNCSIYLEIQVRQRSRKYLILMWTLLQNCHLKERHLVIWCHGKTKTFNKRHLHPSGNQSATDVIY